MTFLCSQKRVGSVIMCVVFLRSHYSLLTTHKKSITILSSFMARNLFGSFQCEPKKARSSVEQDFYLLLFISIGDC